MQHALPVDVFAKFRAEAYPYAYEVQLELDTIAGGTPTDPKVAMGWLQSRLGIDGEELARRTAQVMAERGASVNDAIEAVVDHDHLNGFKRTRNGILYVEGRQIKAMMKEAGSIAVSVGALDKRGWGSTNKGLSGFFAEHFFVADDVVLITDLDGTPLTKPNGTEPSGAETEVNQRFVHTFRGNGIQYEEWCTNVLISYTIMADYEMKEKDWAMIHLKGGFNGLGSSRSQGFGRFTTVKFNQITPQQAFAAKEANMLLSRRSKVEPTEEQLEQARAMVSSMEEKKRRGEPNLIDERFPEAVSDTVTPEPETAAPKPAPKPRARPQKVAVRQLA